MANVRIAATHGVCRTGKSRANTLEISLSRAIENATREVAITVIKTVFAVANSAIALIECSSRLETPLYRTAAPDIDRWSSVVKLRLHRLHSYTFISGTSVSVGSVRASIIGCEQFGQSSTGRFISISVFKRLQIGDHVADLAGIKLKLWHAWMARRNAFSQSFGKVLDGILQVQGAKRRRDFQGTGADLVDGMTLSAVRAHEGLPSLSIRL